MCDTDKLRPEVEEQIAHCDGKDCRCMAYGPSECACDADWTPAEVYLLRARIETAEAELAAIKARIAGSSVVKIANYGDPLIVLPDHLTVPNSLKGKTVRLLVEE